MTLNQYCDYLGWTIAQLARESGINWQTASNAIDGLSVTRSVARKIASAISAAMGQTVHPGDIVDLKFF